MRSGVLAELAEALGACLVVLGLVFWSLPVALVTAGLFLLAVANAPGASRPGSPPARGGSRAEARR
jgi:hypothetical protein